LITFAIPKVHRYPPAVCRVTRKRIMIIMIIKEDVTAEGNLAC